MKIGVLASESSWYFRDLQRAISFFGHQCARLDFEQLVASVGTSSTRIEIVPVDKSSSASTTSKRLNLAEMNADANGGQNRDFDVVLVRTMPPGSLEQVVFRMDLLQRLESMGVAIVNPPKSLECAVDKYLTTARLQGGGLPVPATIVCEREETAIEAFESLGGDVVVKPLFGSEGRGIVRVSDPDLAHRTFRTLMRLNAVLYLQQFVDHGGYDVRVMVLNGKVIGGMRRYSANDFRTNVAREGKAEQHQPTPLECELALKAAALIGTWIAGIDLLYDRDGRCYVIEVNAVPGWQAFNRVSGLDTAMLLVQEILPTADQRK